LPRLNPGLQPRKPRQGDESAGRFPSGLRSLHPDLALRAGFNYAANPVPTETLTPLFPDTVRRHYTFGFGWRMDKDSTLAGSIAYAPRESDTNPNTGISSTHRQTTLRVNYNFS
jgi:long-chain fatty acid transport protein